MLARGLVALVGALLCAAPAIAAVGAEPLSVEWKVHGGCPDANVYWYGVVSRSKRIRRASSGESATQARVQIKKVGDQSVGTLTIDGAPREVTAATCGEVVEAMALMTVLALDPEAITSPPVPAPSSASPPVSASSPPPVAPASASSAPPIVVPPPPKHPAPAPDPYAITLVLGAQVVASGAGPTFGVPLAIEVSRAGPSARLTLTHARSGLVRNERGPAARFAWSTARLDGCPLAWGSHLLLRACAGFAVGALSGTPEDVANPRAEWRPWLAVHLVARAEWRFSQYFGLELEGAAAAPLLREEFVVDPDYFLYRPPAVLASGQLAVTMHFR